jgi:2-iminobutanoate/2-iminopropanoate deaminase
VLPRWIGVVLTDRKPIATRDAAAPAAFYSQAIRTGDLVFTAGCVGIDPSTGEIEPGGVEPQVRRTIRNVEAILDAAGSSLAHAVKTTCFIKRVEDFPLFDRIYREYFSGEPPARTTIRADLVRDEFLVEVEAVAVRRT